MIAVDMEQARHNMIEQQIRPWEVLDQRVLDVIASVPRERFVPEAWRNLAFADLEIPLGHGEYMMAPKVEARLLQSLEIRPLDRILEIGTGSGFLTACLARLGAQVVTVDIVPEFSQQAQQLLTGMEYENIEFRVGDAATGWDADGQFDVVAITGSLPELPDSYRHILNDGGRLFVVTGQAPVMEAQVVRRIGNDWIAEGLFETNLPRLQNVPERRPFTL